MKKRMILVTVIVILLIGAIFVYRHFVLERIVDIPGMENPAEPMLELLNAEWMSEDGVWSAHIGGKEGNTFNLSYRQELVYSGNFSFVFQGNNLNVKTELAPFMISNLKARTRASPVPLRASMWKIAGCFWISPLQKRGRQHKAAGYSEPGGVRQAR